MTAKYQRVVTAHEDTFNWILEEHPNFSSPNGGEKNANFQKWFRENSMDKWMRRQTRDGEKNNVYWIGKINLDEAYFQAPKNRSNSVSMDGEISTFEGGLLF
jgi:hypothetical protein